MNKYTDEVIDHLLQHLDGLDVLELIDYHPESIQLEDGVVHSYCPLCQDLSDRYLTVDLKERTFRSEPPGMPPQVGTLVDLFARVRRIDLDQAVEELADEFGILLLDSETEKDPDALLEEAETFLEEAKAEKGKPARKSEEAIKRFSHILEKDAENRRALAGLQAVRLIEKNPVTLYQATSNLIECDKAAGNHKGVIDAAKAHLDLIPDDLPVRGEMARAYAAAGQREEAVNELLTLAEMAEKAGQLDQALSAYREARNMESDAVDVFPMIFSFLTSHGMNQEAVRQTRQEIDRLKKRDDYRQASRVAQNLLKLNANDDEVRIQSIELAIMAGLDSESRKRCLGLVDDMISAGRHENAAEALSYLSAERPEDGEILEKLIETFRKAGNEEAVQELDYRLMDLWIESGQGEKVLEKLHKRLEENPEDCRGRMLLGRTHDSMGQKEKAIEVLREAVDYCLQSMDEETALEGVRMINQIDPALWNDREQEVEMLWAMGKAEESKECLRELIRDLDSAQEDDRLVEILEGHRHRDPNHLETLDTLARLYDKKGQAEKASEIRHEAVDRLVQNEAYEQAETMLLEFLKTRPSEAGLLEKLDRIYKKTAQKNKRREVVLKLAACYRDTRRVQEEVDLLSDALEGAPNDLELVNCLYEAQKEAGDREGMIQTAERQIELLTLSSDYKAALKKAESLLEEMPGHEGILKSLLTIYEKLQRKEDVLNTARQLAESYRESGRTPEEQEILELLLAQNPGEREARERLIEILAQQKEHDELLAQIRTYGKEHGTSGENLIELMKRVLAELPEMTDLRLELIGILRKQNRQDDLIEQLQSAVEYLEEEQDSDSLIELYRELLSLRPDNQIARARLVELLKAAGKHEEAVRQHQALAQQYREARQLKQAAEAYEKMSADNPRNEEILSAYASLLQEMGQREPAARKLCQLATVLAEKGSLDKAIKLLKEAIEHDPEDVDLRHALIEKLRDDQKFDEAAGELRALADFHKKGGDTKSSIASLREAVALDPDTSASRRSLIDELEQMGRHEEAQAEQLRLAESLSSQGLPQRALSVTDEILGKNPSSLPTRRLRAQIFDAMGEEMQALAEYREMQNYLDRVDVQVVDPEDPEEQTGGFFPGLQVLPEYDFDSFIVGSKNNFAYATAKAVADHPGTVHNPLFLYSDVGLGKTHLLHAIANELRRKRPDIRILYASTEYFTSALIEAIQNNTVTAFRNRHRRSDVLLLDDVQFLAGKERSQEEFFHIFNILHQDGRQIVVTSDRPPKDIAHLDKRIRSRFGQGVIVDIQPPDLETRTAILKAESERRKIRVPDEAMMALAERISSNVRELKGAFNQLVTQHELCGDELTATTANSIVDKFFAT